MREAALLALLLIGTACGSAQHEPEEIAFDSGPFHIIGELRLPAGDGPYPMILFVHGDGPNNRTSGVTYPPIMERMLRAGYATFAWDKPGTGESTGEIDRKRLVDQRARIVLDALALIEQHAEIDAGRIGLWGISQAGYVMPRVLSQSEKISFVIAVSCPGQAGVEQGAYLVSAQARCDGAPEEDVRLLRNHLAAVEYADTYDEYLRHVSILRGIPAFMELDRYGVRTDGRSKDEWHVPDLEGDYFLDPMEVVARITVPVLAFFGELDTQADPYQGAQAYREALALAGNPVSRVELIPDSDHNIILSETGCLEERNRRTARGWRDYAPEYLDILEQWLRERRRPDPQPQP